MSTRLAHSGRTASVPALNNAAHGSNLQTSNTVHFTTIYQSVPARSRLGFHEMYSSFPSRSTSVTTSRSARSSTPGMGFASRFNAREMKSPKVVGIDSQIQLPTDLKGATVFKGFFPPVKLRCGSSESSGAKRDDASAVVSFELH